MKTKHIKIKLTFFFIAKYLYFRVKELRCKLIEYMELLDSLSQGIKHKISVYENMLKHLQKQLSIEKEYNLNARMRRRNRYWRKTRNF